MSNQSNRAQAIKDLKKYGNVSSVDDFMLRAVQGGEGEEVDINEVLDDRPDARIFSLITNMSDGAWYTNEISVKADEIVSSADGDTSETTEALANMFYIVAPSGIGGAGGGTVSTGVNLNAMLGDLAGSSSTPGPCANPTAPSKAQPTMSCIQILPAMMNYGIKDSGAVEIFMNMIPTLEWSRATPYLDVQVITPGVEMSEEGKIQSMGQLRFLNGKATVGEGTGDRIIGTAQSADMYVPPPTSDSGDGTPTEDAPEVFSSAGMEIFTSPQTLVPAGESYRSYDEVAALETPPPSPDGTDDPWPGQPGAARAAPIIDKMRPFMTMTDFTVQVVPTRGMMSHKTAEMSIMLHDRSRLGEISALVQPSAFGKTEILVEYGWSHPDGDLTGEGDNRMTRNPFGAFINSLRVKEKFGVVNTSYSFESDGQVSVKLSLVTRGVSSIRINDVGLAGNATTKFQALEELITAINALRRSMINEVPEMADVGGMSTIANLSPTNAADLFGGDDARTIQNFITQASRGGGDMQALGDMLKDAKEATSEIQSTIATNVGTKIEIAKSSHDPYLRPRHSESASELKFEQFTGRTRDWPKDNNKWCSFGRLAALFIGLPLVESKKFEEVQLIFYTFNDKSSYMHDKNIASFPVEMNGNTGMPKLFEGYREEKVQVTVNNFMQFMNRYFLSNMAAKAYGFDASYTRNDEGIAEVRRRIGAATLSSRKDAVLRRAYGEDADLEFSLPRIRMVPEAIPHQRPESTEEDAFGAQNTILRIHFFDDSATKYSGLHQLLKAARSSEMGTLRAAAAARPSGNEDTHDSQWTAIHSALREQLGASNILETIGSSNYSRIKGGVPALKHFIKSNMPSITWGSQNCAVNSISVQSMHNSADTTIHMIRAQRNSSSDNDTPGEQDRGLPLRMMPMKCSMEVMGCPIIHHGQQFFVDVGTGTTVDNVYAVMGLEHNFSPGNFTTKFEMVPIDAFGVYSSMVGQVDAALAAIEAAEAESSDS